MNRRAAKAVLLNTSEVTSLSRLANGNRDRQPQESPKNGLTDRPAPVLNAKPSSLATAIVFGAARPAMS
jgi:hypothetical protein